MIEPLVRPRPDDCLSDLALDRLLGGELTGTPAERLARNHLGRCPHCQRRRAQIQAVPPQQPDPVWLAIHAPELPQAPPAVTPASPPRGARRSWSRAAAAGAGVVCAAAAIAILARPRSSVETTGPASEVSSEVSWPSSDVTRVKGGALSLEIFVRRAGGRTDPVSPTTVLRARDEIGFRVRASEPGYLAVLGLDGEGRVSRYAPGEPDAPALRLAAPGAQVLDRGVILDGSRGDERVIAVLCPSAAVASGAAAAARAALASAGGAPARVSRLDLPCVQATASFRKETAP